MEGVARLYVVSSADMAAIHVVNELFAWLNTISSSDCRFGGVVVNNLAPACNIRCGYCIQIMLSFSALSET